MWEGRGARGSFICTMKISDMTKSLEKPVSEQESVLSLCRAFLSPKSYPSLSPN